MAVIFKIIYVFIFLTLLAKAKGSLQCSMENLTISQTPTGAKVSGKTEWKVTIKNECKGCPQFNVRLKCGGFNTSEAINPTSLAKLGAQCVVNGGFPIYSAVPITFTYAWDPAFNFKPFFSQVGCA